MSELLVIPCLNEIEHIDALLSQVRRVSASDTLIVVTDGGSSDGTIAVVDRHVAKDERVRLLHNPRRIQSCAVNLAVERFGKDRESLIRIDAHCEYPDDYVTVLRAEAERTGADSVVVSMHTAGHGPVQRANAAAQNSPLGNGGSKHRRTHGRAEGEWVDHGHHAFMRVAAFKAVGGYDETFSHNEDAELDHRLRAAGYRIYLTARTRCTYFPRETFGGLLKQYVAYGRGRARNVVKHRTIPKVRQLIPLMVAPTLLFGLLAFVHPIALVPALTWVSACVVMGLVLARRHGDARIAMSAVSAMTMHFGWSYGFWTGLMAAVGSHTVQGEVKPT